MTSRDINLAFEASNGVVSYLMKFKFVVVKMYPSILILTFHCTFWWELENNCVDTSYVFTEENNPNVFICTLIRNVIDCQMP